MSGRSSRNPRSGDRRCEPQAGQVSGTPRMCRMTDDVDRLIAFSVVETAASASCHLEPLACVSQLTKLQALSNWFLKRCRRSLCESPAMVTVEM